MLHQRMNVFIESNLWILCKLSIVYGWCFHLWMGKARLISYAVFKTSNVYSSWPWFVLITSGCKVRLYGMCVCVLWKLSCVYIACSLIFVASITHHVDLTSISWLMSSVATNLYIKCKRTHKLAQGLHYIFQGVLPGFNLI